MTQKNTPFYTFSDPIHSPQSSKTSKKVKKLCFWTNFKQLGQNLFVSLFAFIHFCSLFGFTSINLSSWLKLLSEIKQFVSSANSFTITWSNDLFISFINKRNNIGPRTDPWGTPYSHKSDMSD